MLGVAETGAVAAYLAGEEGEICGVELVGLLEVGHTHAEVAQFMDGRGALLEALELIDTAMLLLRLFMDCVSSSQPAFIHISNKTTHGHWNFISAILTKFSFISGCLGARGSAGSCPYTR